MKIRDRLASIAPDEWLGGAVFVVAAVASSVSWFELALLCGFAWWMAWVPAVALDLGGLYYGRNWIVGSTERLRRWGQVTTILAVLTSVGGNVAAHLVAAGLLAISVAVVASVGSVPAVALFAVAHQWALRRAPSPETTAPRVVQPAPERAPGSGRALITPPPPNVPGIAAVPDRPARPAKPPARTNDGPRDTNGSTPKRDAARAYARTHWPVTSMEIVRGVAPLEISVSEASRARDFVAQERAAVAS